MDELPSAIQYGQFGGLMATQAQPPFCRTGAGAGECGDAGNSFQRADTLPALLHGAAEILRVADD